MLQNKKQSESKKAPVFELKPLKELKGFESAEANAFVCDMEAGICGPVNKEKGTK